jgi:drug/metabolite transporter (DMT)-like permease
VLAGALLASTFFFFILSLMRNTAANTFVLMSTGPFFAAIFGAMFLGERVPRAQWLAISVALGGATLMFADGLDSGRIAGQPARARRRGRLRAEYRRHAPHARDRSTWCRRS